MHHKNMIDAFTFQIIEAAWATFQMYAVLEGWLVCRTYIWNLALQS